MDRSDILALVEIIFVLAVIGAIVVGLFHFECEEQIISLDYQSEVSGHFILGSGYIGEDQYFVAYKVLEDGGKKLAKYPADKTTIYDTVEEGGVTYASVTRDGFDDIVEVKLYVPKDVIQKEYDLSLE